MHTRSMASSSSSNRAATRHGDARKAPRRNNTSVAKGTESVMNSETSIWNLHFEILMEIFLRLPVFTIFHCKGVCKVWYEFLSSSKFSTLYIRNPSHLHLAFFSKHKVRSSTDSVAYHWLEIGKDGDSTEKLISGKRLHVPKKDHLIVSSSCNGLLCLVEYSDNSCIVHVNNPITREYISLPHLKLGKNVRNSVYGFGFSGHYKVIRIQTMQVSRAEVRVEGHIYTIGVDQEWRQLAFDDFGMQFLKGSGIIVNESFHWMVDQKFLRTLLEVRREVIYAFHIGEETYRSIPPPPAYNGSMILAEIRSCLCAFDNSRNHQLDIWTMKEYGRAQSWTKDFIVRNWIDSAGLNIILPQPITVWKNEEILMCSYGSPHLISFDPKGRNAYALKVSGFEKNSNLDMLSYPILFVPSFVSLRDVVQSGHLRVLQV